MMSAVIRPDLGASANMPHQISSMYWELGLENTRWKAYEAAPSKEKTSESEPFITSCAVVVPFAGKGILRSRPHRAS